MRRLVVVLCLLVSACNTTPREPDLAEAMDGIDTEVATAITDLRAVLGQDYENLPEMYQRLTDLRLGPNLAILFDRAGRVVAPSHEGDIARYAEFVGQALLAAEDMDVAVAGQDLLGISIAWLRIEAEAGALAVALDPMTCSLLTPAITSDLCRPDLPTGYEADLDRSIRRFLAAYRPAIQLPEAFGETVQGLAVAGIAPEVVIIIDLTLDDLGALSPPNAYVGIAEAFTRHLLDLRTIWSGIDTHQTDPLLWDFLAGALAGAACDAIDPYQAGRALLRAAHPDSTVPLLADLWLRGEPTGCR